MDRDQPQWDDGVEVEGKYANCFRVGRNELEVMLDFGQCTTPGTKVRTHTRIVTNPVYARNLLEALRRSVEENGDIPQPSEN